MTETAKKISVMQAFVDGKTIQIKHESGTLGWDDFKPGVEPFWTWDVFDYRIKPEPLELWVNVYPGYDVIVYKTKQAALQAVQDDGVTTLFRQVMGEDEGEI